MSHSSMDKPSSAMRPYCRKHKTFFRNWVAAYAHKATHSGCVLETRTVRNR